MKKYFIGADVSKKTLDCVLYDDNSLKMKESHIKITNDREGRDWLVKWMKGLGVTVKDAFSFAVAKKIKNNLKNKVPLYVIY